MLKSLDINLAGDFLVMAATLMQIKSAMLLPKDEIDQADIDDIEDPRAELIRQLLEYKKFKDAANLLEARVQEHQNRYPRSDSILEKIQPEEQPELDMDSVSVWDLLDAFDTVLKATGNVPDISHIFDDTPIDLYQIDILDRLQRQGPLTFQKLFESAGNRLVKIGLFLALLELCRNELIKAEQSGLNADIYLRALVNEPAETAVQNAIVASEELERFEQTDSSDKPEHSTETDAPEISERIPIQEIAPTNLSERNLQKSSTQETDTKIENQTKHAPSHADPQIPISEIQQKQSKDSIRDVVPEDND
jgi:segregation and condensation protein A